MLGRLLWRIFVAIYGDALNVPPEMLDELDEAIAEQAAALGLSDRSAT